MRIQVTKSQNRWQAYAIEIAGEAPYVIGPVRERKTKTEAVHAAQQAVDEYLKRREATGETGVLG